jgi:hypothetical protein
VDHNILGWPLFGSLLLVVVSHRRPDAARVKTLGRYCSYGLAVVLLLNVAAFI